MDEEKKTMTTPDVRLRAAIKARCVYARSWLRDVKHGEAIDRVFSPCLEDIMTLLNQVSPDGLNDVIEKTARHASFVHLEHLSLELCYEIEKLPASELQTHISVMASSLHGKLQYLLDQAKLSLQAHAAIAGGERVLVDKERNDAD